MSEQRTNRPWSQRQKATRSIRCGGPCSRVFTARACSWSRPAPCAGACDPRIGVVGVSGHFNKRESLHEQPIYRNVWSLLREFGDAEVAALVAPRKLILASVAAPGVYGPVVRGPEPPSQGRSG